MKYEGMIIRPPSEAHSLLLQVTVGCSHNKCTFCGAYKEKKFRIKSDAGKSQRTSMRPLSYRRIEKVFLCDGDALIIPQERLKGILVRIKENISGTAEDWCLCQCQKHPPQERFRINRAQG